jgi:hypothetical protein
MSKLLLPSVLAFIVPMGAVAQAAQAPCTPPGVTGKQDTSISRIGVGTPYTLTAVIKADMITSDGVKTTGGVTTSFQARDGQGRTRIDSPGVCLLVKGEPRWAGDVVVNDPVANSSTRWNVMPVLPRKTGILMNGALKDSSLSAEEDFDMFSRISRTDDRHPDAEDRIHHKVEDLGARTILGFEARGMRITTTYPPGFLSNSPATAKLLPDNNRPFTQVEERWTSVQYHLILLDTIDNEAMGNSSYEVTNLTIEEPDPSLFQPPPDYTITAMPAK